MKSTKIIVIALFVFLFALSCEKDEPNPFIGTWEFSNTTDISSLVMTMLFRSDMTMTYSGVLIYNGQTTNTSLDYSYSYTETTITMQEDGEPEETTEYLINENYLVLSPGSDYEMTFTKTN
ncbi:MAG: hypothetical protein U5K32_09065 [Bacteroidales bacterium]|nr:hypothetical protein [Bacteroidales bacterium]